MELLKNDIALLGASPLLDSTWYRKQYPDVDALEMNPAEHYLRIGAQMLRNPSERFNTRYYLEANPDVAGSPINPLVHYLRFGRREGRTALPPTANVDPGLVLAASAPAQTEHSHVYLSEEQGAYTPDMRVALCLVVHAASQCEALGELLSNLPSGTRFIALAPAAEHAGLERALSESGIEAELVALEPGMDEVALFLALAANLHADGIEAVCRLAPGLDGVDAPSSAHVASLIGKRASVAVALAALANEPGVSFVGPARLFHAQLKESGAGAARYFDAAAIWGRPAAFAGKLVRSEDNSGAASFRILVDTADTVGLMHGRDIGGTSVVVDARLASPLALIGDAAMNETQVEATCELIRSFSAFDESFYAQQTKEAQLLGMDPLYHYVVCGEAAHADPAPWFSSRVYRVMHGRMLAPGENAFAHYLSAQHKESLLAFPSLSNYGLIASILQEAGLVDPEYYLENNPDVKGVGADPLRHYCRYGWSELRRPNRWFDGWWYGVTYMGELDGVVNPLLHYALLGKAAGYETAPVGALQDRIGTGMRYTAPYGAVKRIALYAGYDVDGIIDEYVLAYLASLSQVADVYYLADADIGEDELEKLRPYVKGAWAVRHQTYDFGSYSLLAKQYVGWDVIEQYDELILANDSCYLVGDFRDVFATMHERQCDWWGLQATKGIAATAHVASNQFSEKIALSTVKSRMLSRFEEDYLYDFHVGSYFLCYRKTVIGDSDFRRFLDGVKKERTKKLIIQRYEIGLTKYLINKGYEFDTLIDDLYPFHPIFTTAHFELIDRGFPLLKRFLLSENHYRIPELHRWKEWLTAVAPAAPLAMIETNLQRVVNSEKLYASLNVNAEGKTQQERLLSDEEMAAADAYIEKHDHWWIFPVCGYNHTLGGNERAVFEHVKNDETIKKIVLTRSRHVALEGKNVVIVPIRSVEGQQYLLRSKVVFVKHTPTRNVVYPLRADLRHFINLWHGIPLKRIGAASLDQQARLEKLYEEHRRCRSVIASSKIDQMAMASAFYPLTYNDVWVTGLPRNDFVVCADEKLPEDMMDDVRAIQAMLGGKRLVLYAPTFRNPGPDSYYDFSGEEKRRLKELLDRHGCVLGIREHLADKTRSYSTELREIGAINLGDKRFSNIEVIYRCADVLLTDYSSCFIDYMLTGKPMLSFAYDFDRYISQERGLFYDMEMVFPGPICKNFEALYAGLERALEGQQQQVFGERYTFARSIFFDYLDDKNSERLVARVNNLKG